MSATTHSAAVKRLLHVAVQPLIAEVWFPLLLRGPSPASPAPPGSPGRTRQLRNARGGEKTLFNFPPPARSSPGHSVAPQPSEVRKGWSLPLAGWRAEQKETRACTGEVHPRSRAVVSSILYVPHYNLRAVVQTGRTPTPTFCSFRLSGQTSGFVS